MRLGCLIVLLAIAIGAYFTRDSWVRHLPWRSSTAVAAAPEWTLLSEAGADRTRQALTRLSAPKGPVYVTLAGSDVASYIFMQLTREKPAASDSFAARIEGDRVGLRASMNVADLGRNVLGVLGSLLRDRERVEMWGTLRVIGPARSEFQVRQVKVRDVALPDLVISRLVKPMVPNPRLSGLDENSLPISIPSYIGDVRVANGKITLYKNIQ